MYRLLNDGFKEGVYAVILADGSYIHSYHIYHAAVLHIFLDMELVNKGRWCGSVTTMHIVRGPSSCYLLRSSFVHTHSLKWAEPCMLMPSTFWLFCQWLSSSPFMVKANTQKAFWHWRLLIFLISSSSTRHRCHICEPWSYYPYAFNDVAMRKPVMDSICLVEAPARDGVTWWVVDCDWKGGDQPF